MNLPASWRALGRLAGWAVPVLAGLFLLPSGARGECGDYVTTRLSHNTTSALPPAPPRPHKPCHGPRCSRAPVAPTAPAPTAPSRGGEEWSCALRSVVLAVPGSVGCPREQHVQRPARLAPAIFHPPRLAA